MRCLSQHPPVKSTTPHPRVTINCHPPNLPTADLADPGGSLQKPLFLEATTEEEEAVGGSERGHQSRNPSPMCCSEAKLISATTTAPAREEEGAGEESSEGSERENLARAHSRQKKWGHSKEEEKSVVGGVENGKRQQCDGPPRGRYCFGS